MSDYTNPAFPGWRLPPVEQKDLTPEQTEAFKAGLRPEHVGNYFPAEQRTVPWPLGVATMLHNPKLAKRWLEFSHTLMYEGTITPRQREIMVLRVGWRTRSEYEWIQHCRLAYRWEISYDEIVAISEGKYDDFPQLEQDLLAATDDMLDAYKISDETWARLTPEFSPAQLEEIAYVIGSYTGLAMLFGAHGAQIEPEWADTPAPAFPEE